MEEDEDILFDQATLLSSDGSHRIKPASSGALGPSPGRLFRTVCLCAAFFGLGLTLAIPGPTLLDLQDTTNTTVAEISWIFTGRSVGYLFGSIVGGFLFDRINQPCLLSLSLLLTAVGTAAAPWCKKLSLLVSIVAFQGLSMGFLDTGGNVLCLYTWGRNSGPYMQAMHCAFGIGAFVAPLIAEPFLSRSVNTTETAPPIDTAATVSEQSGSDATVPVNETMTTASPDVLTSVKGAVATVYAMIPNLTKVHFAYLVVALVLLAVSVMFMVLCVRGRLSLRALKNQEIQPEYMIRKENKGFRVQILILLFVFYFLYVGMEVTYGGLIMTFAVDHMGWTKERGTLLTSVYWGSFAAARFVAIFLARCVSPALMLIADLFICSVSLFVLVMGLGGHPQLLWICTATLGVGMASIFPTGIIWAERYMQVTGKATAVFVVGSALGEMSMPLLVGWLFEAKSPMWLMYVLLAATIFSIVMYVIMQNLATNKGERYEKLASLIGLPRRHGEAGDGDTASVNGEASHYTADDDNHSVQGRKKKVTFNEPMVHGSPQGKAASLLAQSFSRSPNPKNSILKGKSGFKGD